MVFSPLDTYDGACRICGSGREVVCRGLFFQSLGDLIRDVHQCVRVCRLCCFQTNAGISSSSFSSKVRTAPGSYTGGQGGLGKDVLLTISSSEEELCFSVCSTLQNRFWMMMGTSG